MLKVSEDYLIIGFDLSHSDVATMTVAQRDGSRIKYLNTLRGEEAILTYEKLTNVSLERNNENVQRSQS